MNYNKERLVKALALNSPATEKLEKELQEKIDAVNAFIREDKTPTAASLVELGAKVTELEPFSMWCDTLRCLINYCDKEQVTELTDEQARIALTRARKFTKWSYKVNNTTKYYEKKGGQENIDLISMFDRLGVDISEFKKYFPSLTLSIALLANSRLSDKEKADPSAIIANYKGDEEVRKNLMNGADLSSRNSICKAIDACINAFIPSAGYKSFKRDAEALYISGTAVSRKDFTEIKSGISKKVLATFLDYVSKLLNTSGRVIYNVKYKSAKIEPKEYDMLIEEEVKPEETAEKSAAPEQEKPKRERKPKPEKAAAKQSKEPAAKTGKGKSGKSKTEAAA